MLLWYNVIVFYLFCLGCIYHASLGGSDPISTGCFDVKGHCEHYENKNGCLMDGGMNYE
jgi:hypothetical protein